MSAQEKPWHSAFYKRHLKSPRWIATRRAIIARAQNRCESCGIYADDGLQVHHKTYARLGSEDPDDLEALCVPCHKIADRARAESRWYERKEEAYRRFRAEREPWSDWTDDDDMREEFEFNWNRKRN